MKTMLIWLAAACLFAVGTAGAADADDEDNLPCAAAEIAAARGFVPTAVQLKAFVDAYEDLAAATRKDAALAAALRADKKAKDTACRIDGTTTVTGQAGAKAMFARQPAAARIFTSRGVTAVDLGRWSFVAVEMAMSTDPKIGSLALQDLSPQQAAFARQQAPELRRLYRAFQQMN